MGIILDALSFLLANIGKLLAITGIVTVGSWAVRKYESSTSSTSSSSTGTSTTTKPTILGTANLWAYALVAVGGLAVLRQYLRDKQK